MQAPRLLRQQVARQLTRRNFSSDYGHGHHHGPVATVNDLPSPQGSWKTNFDSKQRKYNAQLLFGASFLIGTIVFGKSLGFLEFHDDIPERPLDIPSYR